MFALEGHLRKRKRPARQPFVLCFELETWVLRAVNWSARQALHMRSLGPKPGALKSYTPKKWRTRRDLHPQPSRRQRVALLIELRVRNVGSAGNAPARHFRLCFVTPDLQSGSQITSLENW